MLLQLLQSLNLMDYSLLVGIHDSTIPAGEMSDLEDFSDDDESGEECTDLPLSPSNTGELTFFYKYIVYTCNCSFSLVMLDPFCLATCAHVHRCEWKGLQFTCYQHRHK